MRKCHMKKKTILLLVEGICEVTAFEKAFEDIKKHIQIKFIVMDGDPMTDVNLIHESIKKTIGSYISHAKKRYKLTDDDILMIAQITDTDGAYIGEEDVIINPNIRDRDEKEYEENTIAVKNPRKKNHILFRNKDKLKDLNTLSKENTIASRPYRLYFFSCNLDHILYNQAEPKPFDKNNQATDFAKIYPNFKTLKKFFSDPNIAIPGTYEQTWDFIKQDENSLKRGSNFHLFLEEIELYL